MPNKITFVQPICGCGEVLAGKTAKVEDYQRRHIDDSPEIVEIPWGRCPGCNRVQELGEPLPPQEPVEPTEPPAEISEPSGEGGEGGEGSKEPEETGEGGEGSEEPAGETEPGSEEGSGEPGED